VQSPSQHFSPASHVLPHPPQLNSSEGVQLLLQQSGSRTVHTLPHCPQSAGVFRTLQLPLQHSETPVHFIPQPPQLSLSVLVFLHELLQHVSPAAQTFGHDPQ
jgi:hypothetical protein